MAGPGTKTSSSAAFGHLKLRHLHLLLLLEKERSITAAAAALNLSQPAVSAMLREMESIFGIHMVERSTRGVTLTPGAQAARRRFAIALAELGSVREEAWLAEQDVRQRLRVGALTVTMVALLPSAIRILLASATPAVQVEVKEGTVDGLTDSLMSGELDCVVGRLAPSWAKSTTSAQKVRQVRLFDEPRCLVCSAGHPIAQEATSLELLARQDWILQPEPSSSRVLFDQLFLDRGLAPPVPVIESASVHSNMEIVALTRLLSMAPRAVARRMIASGELHELAAPVGLARMPLSCVWRRTADDDSLVKLFVQALVEAARQMDATSAD